MTRPLRAARAAAAPSAGLTVAVTGAASPIGQAICRRLANAEGIRQVIALDAKKPGVPTVRWRKADPTDPGLASALHKVDTLVHLAVSDDPALDRAEQRRRTVTGASVALTAAAATGVRHVVLLSSARVYGAFADNPVPLRDGAPVRARPDGSALDDLLAVEEFAARAGRMYPQVQTALLRPAVVVGRGIDHPAGGALDGPRLLVVRGTKPIWQFCHSEDLAGAVLTTVLARLTGPLNVGSEGWLEQSEVERILGRRRVELPADAAVGTATRLHAQGISGDPASQLDYLMHPWAVDADRLRAAGWEPAYTNEDALSSWAQGRPLLPLRITVKGAAVAGGAAAGVSVALVGTAALVRRARRNRRNRR
ncbi:NAD-dependent epimerase/dehydratase family protein [Cryptosporangium aurantiacum]|uniref:UDP-glucose 4-epimerase n=1 Tax=Cryptosporangium aurantiacum TaxID=134849 RepID=A0A1M7QMZ2_9ACTN|nr:NAD-dependent epimerase/dehydratase family protein [Cryptosporangium aurantiacum]SHN32809.1 UDP-glucose 4-epimerase [Cryptosporangium aurantiacum]